METSVAAQLIQGGVTQEGGVWADLGAGNGTFSIALAGLLGERGTVYAVDLQGEALAGLGSAADAAVGARIVPLVADFRQPLGLADLDGVVMANSLHFVPAGEQDRVVALAVTSLRAGGALILVEYDQGRGTPWLPHPVTPRRFTELARVAGLSEPREIGRRRSRFGQKDIYAGVAFRSR